MRCEEQENWKDIEGYEGYYQVSDKGRVKRLERTTKKGRSERRLSEKILKHQIRGHGYADVCLNVGGVTSFRKVHRLVAEAFINPDEKKETVKHLDGDKMNNHVENLKWTTRSENASHAHKMGRMKVGLVNKYGNHQGVKHHNSKITEEDVLFIRSNARKNGGNMTNKKIAEELGVSITTINVIINNKGWKHIGPRRSKQNVEGANHDHTP